MKAHAIHDSTLNTQWPSESLPHATELGAAVDSANLEAAFYEARYARLVSRTLGFAGDTPRAPAKPGNRTCGAGTATFSCPSMADLARKLTAAQERAAAAKQNAAAAEREEALPQLYWRLCNDR